MRELPCQPSAIAPPATPAAGADLPTHTSTNRGILLAKYRPGVQVILDRNAAYSASGLRAVLPVPRREPI